jgi:TPR repeat protein
MIHRDWLLAICCLALSPSQAIEQQRVKQPSYLNSDAWIPMAERPKLEAKALAGDGDAAIKLATFYELIPMSDKDGTYWYTIAAEDGSPVGEYNLGFMLSNGGRDYNNMRAIFWLNKAKADGVKEAAVLLDIMSKRLAR